VQAVMYVVIVIQPTILLDDAQLYANYATKKIILIQDVKEKM
ncbi:33724_t:CDS:1, partial [Racocetra persica]